MKNDLYATNGSDKFLYSGEDGETLFDLQEKFNVPMHVVAYENMLDNEVIEGLTLLIERKNDDLFTLLPDSVLTDAEDIKRKNHVDILCPFHLYYK